METYIRELIQKLYKLYNYNVIEFGNVVGLCSNWGVVKKNGDTSEVVFFSNTSIYNGINIESFTKILCDTLQCKYIKPIQILIYNNDKLEINEIKELCINYSINSQCELILINYVDNKILYYSSGAEDTVNSLISCMNGMMPNKNRAVKSKKPIITYVLITINILVYILTAYLSRNIVDSNINVLILLGAKVNSLIANGQYYRLVTAMFLHGGIVHVSLNMYALYSIGPLVENVYGKGKYIVIYFLSGILSSLASFMFSNSISIGASGAIFGLLGAALIFAIKMKNRIGRGFINNIITVIGINLVIGLSIPNIDNFAHLGGLLGGIVISYVVFRNK
jgi:rhomboid protease GluP